MDHDYDAQFLYKISNGTDEPLNNICDEMFPIIKTVAKNENGFETAINMLLHLEKLTRNANHYESNIRVLIEIVTLCVEKNHWKDLNTYLVTLSSRKLIIKESIAGLLNHCLTLIESLKIEKGTQLELMKVLYGITEGKNYLEIERAKLSTIMAKYYEEENNIDEAIEILQSLKCETISNLDNREKVKIQLKLIKLVIVKEDYMKAQVISERILKKFLEESDQEDLKLDFYNSKIILDCKENYLVTSKHYQSILNCYNDNDPVKLNVLSMAVLYCILAPYDNEQKNCMEILSRKKLLESIPKFKELLTLFLSKEIIEIDSFLEKFKKDLSEYEILNEKTEIGERNWLEIHNRLLEHNILIISLYYKRIYLKRLSEILCITEEKCENLNSKLIVNGRILGKINRLTGIIDFKHIKQPEEILNDWTFNINELTKKMNNVFHEVNKIQHGPDDDKIQDHIDD